MIYSVVCADKKFEKAKNLNVNSARKCGVYQTFEYSLEKDIDSLFWDEHKDILSSSRGRGYWLWKPYFINIALKNINYGDYLIYSDAAICYRNNVNVFIDIMEREKIDIMPFSLGKYIEKEYTKRDILIALEADLKSIYETPQLWAGFIVFRKTREIEGFCREWLEWCKYFQLISDINSKEKNYEAFIENRHDQSIYSVLAKKKEFMIFRDPSQYGMYRERFFSDEIKERSNYPIIIDAHRQGNKSKYIFVKLHRVKAWLKQCINQKKVIPYNEQFR